MKFNEEQKQLLQNMYSESRSFEDFGDKVCFAIMHDELPQIDTVDIVGGFCSVKSGSYEIFQTRRLFLGNRNRKRYEYRCPKRNRFNHTYEAKS